MPKAAEKHPARRTVRAGAGGSTLRAATATAAKNGQVRNARSSPPAILKAAGKSLRKSRRAATPFPFYAVVEIRRIARLPQEVRGRAAVIVGRAKSKRGHWNYSVSLRGLEGTYYLPHTALRPMGTVLKREDLYGDRAWRVTVDGSGAGTRIDAIQVRAG